MNSDKHRGQIHLSFTLDAQAESLLTVAKHQMMDDFASRVDSDRHSTALQACSLHLQVEKDLIRVQRRIRECLVQKMSIIQVMIAGFESIQQILDFTISYVTYMLETENQLMQYHERASYSKSLSIVIFFLCEVKGDYRKAKKIANSTSQLRNHVKIAFEHGVINAFSDEVCNISVSVGKYFGQIMSYSHK